MKKSLFNCTLFRCTLLFGVMAGMIMAFTACEEKTPDTSPKNIHVIMGTLCDENNTEVTDYNTIIQKGIMKWANDPQYDVTVFYPETLEEAEAAYRQWAEETREEKSLIVMANREFEGIINDIDLNLSDSQQVLAFEMSLKSPKKGIHTFVVDHAGLAYLSGAMAALCEEAGVLVGYPTPVFDIAYTNFSEGFRKYRDNECKFISISEGFDGFSQPEKAYDIVKESQFRDHFILPLAGLSNEGVYSYLDECEKSDPENKIMAAGVDVDCSDRSVRIPFSYLINIDIAIDQHLRSWYEDRPWPQGPLGLEKGITAIKINPNFKELGGISKSDFEARYSENLEEAMKKD